MDYIFPVIFIIYIVSAVIGAVAKTMMAPQQSQFPNKQADDAMLDAPVFEVLPEVDEEATGEHPRPMVRRVEELHDVEDKSSSPQMRTDVLPRRQRTRVSKADLRTAMIMSEIVREPRSKRPWPAR